ncbi:MAG: GNAT family N-acetyltransferase [Streptococcaceae bacterium]|nr:GNAT family N-acetyltransferase [Streptococcaceae bacterium]
MNIKMTRDTLSDTYFDALRIRHLVFVKEQGVPETLEMESPIDEAHAIHFVCYDDENQALGTARLLYKGKENFVQRMAVIKEARGKGIANQLLQAVIDCATNKNSDKLTLHAQLSAKNLYVKHGFIEEGEIFQEAGIDHITMIKTLK